MGASNNRVSIDHIANLMNKVTYKCERIGHTTTTTCYAYLDDFHVGHGDSGCVDPGNFNYDLGKKFAKKRAYSDAYNNLWELEGYLLKVTGRLSTDF